MEVRRRFLFGILLPAVYCVFDWQQCGLNSEVNALQNAICRMYRSRMEMRQPWLVGQNTPRVLPTAIRQGYSYSLTAPPSVPILSGPARKLITEIQLKNPLASLCGNRTLLLCLPAHPPAQQNIHSDPVIHSEKKVNDIRNLVITIGSTDKHGNTVNDVISRIHIENGEESNKKETSARSSNEMPGLQSTQGYSVQGTRQPNETGENINISAQYQGPPVNINSIMGNPKNTRVTPQHSQVISPTETGSGILSAPRTYGSITKVQPTAGIPDNNTKSAAPVHSKHKPHMPIDIPGDGMQSDESSLSDFSDKSSVPYIGKKRHTPKHGRKDNLIKEIQKQKEIIKEEIKHEFQEKERKLERELHDLQRRKKEDEKLLRKLQQESHRPEHTPHRKWKGSRAWIKDPVYDTESTDTEIPNKTYAPSDPIYATHSNKNNKQALLRIERALRDLERRTKPDLHAQGALTISHKHTYSEVDPEEAPSIVYKRQVAPVSYVERPQYILSDGLPRKKDDHVVYIRASSVV